MTDCNCGYGTAGVYVHARDCPAMRPLARSSYERSGWNDGRLGQAYDALAAVLEERGEALHINRLLAEIEEMDGPLRAFIGTASKSAPALA